MIPIKPDPMIVEEHYIMLRDYLKSRGKFEHINKWFQENGNRTLEDVVKAEHSELRGIIEDYKCAEYLEIKYLGKVYHYFATSSIGLGKTGYSAYVLVDRLGIKVCPYCDRNYINNVQIGPNLRIKRTSQLDHYYCRKDYPYLAMSFFNLIPSCPGCNLLKHYYPISASPYDLDIDWDKELVFDYAIHSVDYLESALELNITLSCSKRTSENARVFALEDQYSMHNDVVHDLIKKRQMYSESQLEETTSLFPKLYETKHDVIKTLYGLPMNSEQLYRRPLSRMIRDITASFYHS